MCCVGFLCLQVFAPFSGFLLAFPGVFLPGRPRKPPECVFIEGVLDNFQKTSRNLLDSFWERFGSAPGITWDSWELFCNVSQTKWNVS